MDKYEVLRVAGRGAYGTAYLARRKTDGREVILKQASVTTSCQCGEQILHKPANWTIIICLHSDSHRADELR